MSIPRIQKPGLALAGYLPQIHPERVQVIGRTELGYLATLGEDAARQAVDRMLGERVACVVVTNGAVPPPYFEESATRHQVPLITTALKSSELIRNVTAWLEDRLAPHTLIHGVLVEVFGLGVLLLGKSGIGKSEAALDLVARGHRLVADDVGRGPRSRGRARAWARARSSSGTTWRSAASASSTSRISSASSRRSARKAIQLVAEMFDWSKEERADRLGLEDETHTILGVVVAEGPHSDPSGAERRHHHRGRALATTSSSDSDVTRRARSRHDSTVRSRAGSAGPPLADETAAPQPTRSSAQGGLVHVVIVTGLSGSGKSTAIRVLEDLGFYCIDNLPVVLTPKFIELCQNSEEDIPRIALGIDLRERAFLGNYPAVLEDIRRAGHRVEILYLDAADDVLVRRFSETRRPHPLAEGGDVASGIVRERQGLAGLKGLADRIIDTTAFTVHQLRDELRRLLADVAGSEAAMRVLLLSFGYKYGLPTDTDIVLDVRFLPNPFFVEELRALDGTDPAVARFVLERTGDAGVPGAHDGAPRLLAAVVRARGQAVSDRRSRLYRRSASLGRARR